MKIFAVIALCLVAIDAHFETVGLVQSSWNDVKSDAVGILHAVFKAYPNIQAKFPQFDGKNLEEFKDSAEFALHAHRIVDFISAVINLAGKAENMEAIKTLMIQLGTSHRNRGITKEEFDDFHKALMGYVSTHTTWNNDISSAWDQMEVNMHAILYAVLDHKL